MEPGNEYLFRTPESIGVEKTDESTQGIPNYMREYKFETPDFIETHGIVPVADKPMKSTNFYTLGVDMDSKGRVISRTPIPLGAIPEANVDIKINEQYIPHFGTYSDYMMGGMYNYELAQGDMLL